MTTESLRSESDGALNDTYDVLIAGGGPAGLVTAETVAAAGLRALVVERAEEIGSPVHTSGATAIATMERFGVPSDLYHGTARLRFCGPSREAVFDFDTAPLCIIDVRGTYQFLASRAQKAGSHVITAARATSVLKDGDKVIGCTVSEDSRNQEIESRVVVDASGYRASISKSAGLHPGFTRFGVGSEYELIAPHCSQDEAVMVVGSRYAPAGYAWVFPWGESRVRVGVGVHHGDVRSDPRRHLDLFVSEAERLRVDLRGAEVVEHHHGLVPAHRLPDRLVGNGILAVGDAACQATLVVGEGIRISMVAGRLAGDVISAALDNGRADEESLLPYDTRFRRQFGRNLSLGYTMNRRMATFDDDEWDEKIELLASVPPSVLVNLLQSEFPIASTIGALVARPQLWPRILRYAVRGLAGTLKRSG